jgi:hypothetical protein
MSQQHVIVVGRGFSGELACSTFKDRTAIGAARVFAGNSRKGIRNGRARTLRLIAAGVLTPRPSALMTEGVGPNTAGDGSVLL